MTEPPLILVTGATGYIGGRLVPLLLERGCTVRCLVRDAARLSGRPWLERVEVVQGDVLDPATLPPALTGVRTAYYLVHSMSGSEDFHARDRQAASAFGSAAAEAGVDRIIYLGGLGDPSADLSRHLRSRQDTGDALRAAGVPVTEFRAAVVVGAGSVSFEMIRYLTERLPAMICPRWVYTRIQPIAVRDVLAYLVAAPDTPGSGGRVVEIGGADVRTYGDMMTGYARVRGLRRVLIPVPVLTPLLSSYWVHFVTPIPDRIARPLIEGLRNEVVVRGDDARRLFPDIVPMDYESAVREALASLEEGPAETAWSDALVSSQGVAQPVVLASQSGIILERRQQVVAAPPADVFRVFAGLGGDRGYLAYDWAWRLRGALDRMVGGVGLRRGRRDVDERRTGDAVDFWRVEDVVPDRLLRLRAEMRLPGLAWLQFEAQPRDDGTTQLVQTAYFAPRGLAGFAYWYGLYPVHSRIFSGMMREIARAAESRDDPGRTRGSA
jgi:uncharacterized protein YbjT (DUF2867 family)/uncharacterized protein YndB with AHSA1/START domain